MKGKRMKMKLLLLLLAGLACSPSRAAEVDIDTPGTDVKLGQESGVAVKLDNVNFEKLVRDIDAKVTATVGDIAVKTNIEIANFDIKNCGTGVVSTCTNVTGGCNVTAATNCSKTQGLNVAPQVRLFLDDLFRAMNPAMMDLRTLPASAEKRFVLYFRPENSYSQIVEWDRK